MNSFEEDISNKFLRTLLNLSSHIENVSDENTKIGSGIFILSIINSKKNCNMTDIVESLNLVPSTATRQVDSLVKLKMVRRDVGRTDRRKVILSLTKDGKRVNNRFKRHLIKVMRNSIEKYSESEMRQAVNILDKIIEYSEKNLPLRQHS
jgi:DNA-binding MarR family transcriptional regulator